MIKIEGLLDTLLVSVNICTHAARDGDTTGWLRGSVAQEQAEAAIVTAFNDLEAENEELKASLAKESRSARILSGWKE